MSHPTAVFSETQIAYILFDCTKDKQDRLVSVAYQVVLIGKILDGCIFSGNMQTRITTNTTIGKMPWKIRQRPKAMVITIRAFSKMA